LLKNNQIPDLFKTRIRVFNEDFVKKNLNWEEGKASKIMLLGEERIEQKRNLIQILKELEETQKSLYERKKEKEKKEKEKQKFLRKIRDETIKNLRSVDDVKPKSRRAKDYKNYTVNDVEKILKEIGKSSLVSNNKIQYLREALQEKKTKPIIDEIKIDLNWIEDIINQIQSLSKIVISENRLKLLELEFDEKFKEWLRTGYEIHKDKEYPVICEFCKNIIPVERLNELDEYFNEALRNLFEDIELASEALSQDNFPNIELKKEQFYIEFHNSFLGLKDNFNSVVNIIRKELNNFKKRLIEKKNNPSKKIKFSFSNINESKAKLEDIFFQINKLIEKNNEKTISFSKKRQEAAHKLEEAIISKYKSEYDEKEKKLDEIQDEINLLRNKLQMLEGNQNKLEQKLKKHYFAAEEFNKLLKSFIGRSEIAFETVEEGYIIRRNGRIASNLSEGERNAIAFIFSLIKLREENFDAKNGIVVIDDPVSSFDSQYIYGAFGFIKEKIKEINPKQVFIFTHNFQFFRLLREWMKYERNNFRFYMIKSKIDGNRRYSVIEKLDKLLEKHTSEYTYLFKLIFNRSKAQDSDLEKDYIFPNAIRKLLENYLSFKIPLGSVHIHKKFSKLCNEDYPKTISIESKTRIESFCQDQSHPLYQDSPTNFDERLMGEIQAVCSAVVELIQKTDEKHYKHLLEECGIVNSSNE